MVVLWIILSVASLWYGSNMTAASYVDAFAGNDNNSRFRRIVSVIAYIIAGCFLLLAVIA